MVSKIKVAIFDLDDTLIHEGFDKIIECLEAFESIDYLYNNGYKICLATLNEDAVELCKETSFGKYIDFIVAKETSTSNKLHDEQSSKDYHLNKIIDYYGCSPKDCILFDDVLENIQCAEKLGMKGKLVDWQKGVTILDVKSSGLQEIEDLNLN